VEEPPLESSVFGDRTRIPTDDELEATLGPAIRRWEALCAALTTELAPVAGAWSFAGKAYGWSYGLKRRGRAVAYLTPLEGRFRASLAVPERAMPAALEADLPGPIRDVVAGAQAYAEGRAVRFEVASEEDVAAVLALARIRMAS
jgi:hypothetical protein